MKKRGRRFPWLWLYLFTAGGSGCSGCCCEPLGCNDCHDQGCTYNDNSSCNVSICGDGGDCFLGGNEPDSSCLPNCGPPTPAGAVIVPALVHPTAIATDGVEVFFVDDGMLIRVEPDGTGPVLLASGVDVVGNLEVDGLYVHWSGTWSGELGDGGADAGDAGGDGGDAGSSLISAAPGVFRVPTVGGDVERTATLDPLPTLLGDGTKIYLRARSDDGGASALGTLDDDDAGFVAVAGLSGNTENVHAFALRSDGGFVALDDDRVVTIDGDGGKNVVQTLAAERALFGTSAGYAEVVGRDAGFSIVREDGAGIGGGGNAVTALAGRGNRLYVAFTGEIDVYDALSASRVEGIATAGTTPVLVAAADDAVYWIGLSPSPALWRAPLP